MKQATLPARKRTRRSTPLPKVLRADIQGLRALAVAVVVLDHLIAWPSGGFVGVDIFLVISGFLITGHLIREWEKRGMISFTDFYKRRAKRILPAATATIIVTVAMSFVLFGGSRAWSIFWDGLWATFFVGNWRFAASQTDYFQGGGAVSPLQHFWSLGVEEQFYFVWPWLMLGALVVMSRAKALRPHPRVTAGAVIFVLTAASFAWAMHETATSPTVAYFSTFSRAWELGAGALLALAAPACGRISNSLRPVLAWAAVAGMVVSLFVINPESAFPGPWAALPVLSSALFIAAGTGGPQRFLGLFTNRVSGYIGDISYSLYLWHFPVIVFLPAVLGVTDMAYYVSAVVAMLVLASFSYHLIEDPIRNSNWLIPSKTRVETKWKYSDRWVVFFAAFTALAVLLALTAESQATATRAAQYANAAPQLKTVQAEEPTYGPEVTALQKDISAALASSEWPELQPGENSRGRANWMRDMQDRYCVDVNESNVTSCYFPAEGAGKTAVLMGDSHAIAWAPGVRKAAAEAGYNLQMLTMQQCAAADAESLKSDGSAYPECTEHRQWAQQQVESMKPDLVIVSTAASASTRLASKAEGGEATAEYAEGLERTLEDVSAHADDVLLLSSPPTGGALDECMTRISSPADCQKTIGAEWSSFIQAEKEAAKTTDATYVDTRLWFCSPNGACPAYAGDTLIRVDHDHLSIEYSESLAAAIGAEALEQVGA